MGIRKITQVKQRCKAIIWFIYSNFLIFPNLFPKLGRSWFLVPGLLLDLVYLLGQAD